MTNREAIAGVDDPALQRLLHDHWEITLSRAPVWATILGDRRWDDRLADRSPAAYEEGRRLTEGWLERARALDPDTLSPADRLTLALFVEELEGDLRTEACGFQQWNLSPRHNAVSSQNRLPDVHPVQDEEDARNLLARYRQAPTAIEDEIANLRLGLAAGRAANGESTRLTVEMVRRQLDQPVEGWPQLTTLREVEGLPDALHVEARAVVEDVLRPAFAAYADFLEQEILPAARPPEKAGLHGLPDGAACYGRLVRNYTTLDIGAEALHQAGLDELERIHAEMRTLGASVFGTDDLAAIFERLRTDPALYFQSEEEVEAKAGEALARSKAAMVGFFGTLPVADCEVVRVPAYEAPYTTIAYYMWPSPDGSRPGQYFVNTYAPETRPRHEAEVLAFHEAIPGHHLQIAIAQELPDTPAFRRHMGMTAFVEGWGLYSERLADEMGLYSGDLDRLGMLSFDTWRAARLVVDTGLHAEGWTREQAVDFMLANTPLAENNIRNEVDRYLTTPGQALAYKTGQLEIRALRREAEEALGERFDLAAFHDVVLGGGAVTLPVMRDRVEAWIAERAAPPGEAPLSPR